jgi:hypothetical protein
MAGDPAESHSPQIQTFAKNADTNSPFAPNSLKRPRRVVSEFFGRVVAPQGEVRLRFFLLQLSGVFLKFKTRILAEVSNS